MSIPHPPYVGGPAAPVPPKRHRRWPWVLGGIVALIVIVSAAAGSCSGDPSTTTIASPSTSHKAHAHHAKATHSAKPKPKTVKFYVHGSAPAGVDTTYGSDSDNRQGSAHVPWKASLPLHSSVNYYSVSAQLQGGGDITCGIVVGGKVVKRAHASGSYNICMAEVSPGLFGGWDAD